MKQLILLLTLSIFFNGCTQFTFSPIDEAPQNEHDKLIKRAQNALEEQQSAALNK